MLALFSLESCFIFASDSTLTFLHFNDIYQYYSTKSSHGLPGIKKLIDEIKAKNPSTFVSFGGDASPSYVDLIPIDCSLVVKYFKMVGVQAAVFGNHEFDQGVKSTKDCFNDSPFSWIASNINDKDKAKLFQTKYLIKSYGNIKVGIMGLITDDAPRLSMTTPLEFSPVIATAEKLVEIFKKEKVDVIVALTHLFNEEDKELALKVPEINLILGGHDHTAMSELIGNTLIMKAGSDGEFLAEAVMHLHKKKDSQQIFWNWNFHATKNSSLDKTLAKEMEDLIGKMKSSLTDPITTIQNTDIDTRMSEVRSKENIFANFVADSFRDYYNSDIAIINGGAVRGNLYYKAPASLSRAFIYKEMPFRNKCILISTLGKNLKTILETMLNYRMGDNVAFPHISGMTYTYKIIGNKYVVQNIWIRDQKVENEKKYTISTSDYLYRGGDHFPRELVELEHPKNKEEFFVGEVVLNYLTKLKPQTLDLTPRMKLEN